MAFVIPFLLPILEPIIADFVQNATNNVPGGPDFDTNNGGLDADNGTYFQDDFQDSDTSMEGFDLG